MSIKNMSILYHLLLSLGAFYVGGLMFLGRGAFGPWPQEWIGKLPFTSWGSLALFGILVFGFGNLFAFVYGIVKKDTKKVFLTTIMMGALFFFCTILSRVLLGEWYLPTGQFLIASIVQLSLGLLGLLTFIIREKSFKFS